MSSFYRIDTTNGPHINNNHLERLIEHLNVLKLLKKLLVYGKRITKPSTDFYTLKKSVRAHLRELIRKELKLHTCNIKIFMKYNSFFVQTMVDIPGMHNLYNDPRAKLTYDNFLKAFNRKYDHLETPFTYVDRLNTRAHSTYMSFYIPLDNVDIPNMVSEIKTFGELISSTLEATNKKLATRKKEKEIYYSEIQNFEEAIIPLYIEKELNKNRILSKELFDKSKQLLSTDVVDKILQLSIKYSIQYKRRP